MAIQKPVNKSKRDGEVEIMYSDDARFLVMRGDYTKDEIIAAAIEECQIDTEEAEDWARITNYYQCWYKISPIGGPEGYARWHHPRDVPCRGAYFASVLQWD